MAKMVCFCVDCGTTYARLYYYIIVINNHYALNLLHIVCIKNNTV